MTFSVWRPELRQYDYYEDGVRTAAFPSPRHLGGRVAADTAAWPLPRNSRKIGSGPTVQGQVAMSGVESGVTSTCLYIGLGILGYALWRLTKERS